MKEMGKTTEVKTKQIRTNMNAKHTVLDVRSLNRLGEKTSVLKAQRGVALL